MRASSRQRALLLAVAILLHLLIIVALLTMTVAPRRVPESERRLLAFNLSPVPQPTRTATARPHAVARSAPQRPAAAAPAHPPPAVQVKTDTPAPMVDLMPLDLASNDISKVPSHVRSAGEEEAEAGSGADSQAAYGPGEGPGGVKLYAAEWYRKPTDAELSGYLPASGPREGWGEVACRTVPDYRVDDCQQIGEAPAGSGFSRTLRQAAWQFRVRPPRVGGKPMIGAWVRILVTWTPAGLSAQGRGG